jgi:hypothetical protein
MKIGILAILCALAFSVSSFYPQMSQELSRQPAGVELSEQQLAMIVNSNGYDGSYMSFIRTGENTYFGKSSKLECNIALNGDSSTADCKATSADQNEPSQEEIDKRNEERARHEG